MQKGNLMKKTKLWLGLSSVGILFTTSFISLTNVALDNEGLINDVLKLNVEKLVPRDLIMLKKMEVYLMLVGKE